MVKKNLKVETVDLKILPLKNTVKLEFSKFRKLVIKYFNFCIIQ